MQVICIDDKFDQRSIDLIGQRPIINKIYNIREVIPTLDGRVGVLLEELINPPIEISKGMFAEPRFDINRFRHLDMTPLTKEEITELKKVLKKTF